MAIPYKTKSLCPNCHVHYIERQFWGGHTHRVACWGCGWSDIRTEDELRESGMWD